MANWLNTEGVSRRDLKIINNSRIFIMVTEMNRKNRQTGSFPQGGRTQKTFANAIRQLQVKSIVANPDKVLQP